MPGLNMVEINIVDLQKLKKRNAELQKENKELKDELEKLKPKKKERN